MTHHSLMVFSLLLFVSFGFCSSHGETFQENFRREQNLGDALGSLLQTMDFFSVANRKTEKKKEISIQKNDSVYFRSQETQLKESDIRSINVSIKEDRIIWSNLTEISMEDKWVSKYSETHERHAYLKPIFQSSSSETHSRDKNVRDEVDNKDQNITENARNLKSLVIPSVFNSSLKPLMNSKKPEQTTPPNVNPMYIIFVKNKPCRGMCCKREPFTGNCRLDMACTIKHFLLTNSRSLSCGTSYKAINRRLPKSPFPPTRLPEKIAHNSNISTTISTSITKILDGRISTKPVLEVKQSTLNSSMPVEGSYGTHNNSDVKEIETTTLQSAFSSRPKTYTEHTLKIETSTQKNELNKEFNGTMTLASNNFDSLANTTASTFVGQTVLSKNSNDSLTQPNGLYTTSEPIFSTDSFSNKTSTILHSTSDLITEANIATTDSDYEFPKNSTERESGFVPTIIKEGSKEYVVYTNNNSEWSEFEDYWTDGGDIDYNYDEYTNVPDYSDFYDYGENSSVEGQNIPETDRVNLEEGSSAKRKKAKPFLLEDSLEFGHGWQRERDVDAEWLIEENKRGPHLVMST